MAIKMLFYIIIIIIASAVLITNSYALLEKEINIPLQFGYTGDKSPDKWGKLSPNFSACSHGKLQSPIDIPKDKVVVDKNLKPLIREYYSANATLVDNGFNVGLRYGNNSGILNVDGKIYALKQMHWHAPSEHMIDGIRFVAELHLVHVADDGSVCVVATLYKYGHADPLLAKIQYQLAKLAREAREGDEEPHITLGPVNTKELRKHTRKYYRYVGSFTTPPCTENVIWNILGKVRSISREQVAELEAPLSPSCKRNARPVQPLNTRQIKLYEELQ